MATGDRSRDIQPIAAFRRAFVDGTVRVLRAHPIVRVLVGLAGALVFLVGALLAPFWNVPLVSWLTAGEVAGPALALGLYALGVWHLSGKRPSSSEKLARDTAVSGPSDVVARLSQLHDLHARGALTNEEFHSAKSKVLGGAAPHS